MIFPAAATAPGRSRAREREGGQGQAQAEEPKVLILVDVVAVADLEVVAEHRAHQGQAELGRVVLVEIQRRDIDADPRREQPVIGYPLIAEPLQEYAVRRRDLEPVLHRRIPQGIGEGQSDGHFDMRQDPVHIQPAFLQDPARLLPPPAASLSTTASPASRLPAIFNLRSVLRGTSWSVCLRTSAPNSRTAVLISGRDQRAFAQSESRSARLTTLPLISFWHSCNTRSTRLNASIRFTGSFHPPADRSNVFDLAGDESLGLLLQRHQIDIRALQEFRSGGEPLGRFTGILVPQRTHVDHVFLLISFDLLNLRADGLRSFLGRTLERRQLAVFNLVCAALPPPRIRLSQ